MSAHVSKIGVVGRDFNDESGVGEFVGGDVGGGRCLVECEEISAGCMFERNTLRKE
jgi:hypothetical protein